MDARAKDDDDVLANVMPAIIGPPTPAHPSGRNVVFRNLESLTDGTIAPAAPDIYYGAQPEGLCRPARDALRHHIMPSTMESRPLAPNFFVEVKGPDGSAAVASRQIRYDGAYGARAMHSLQNYGTEGDLQYDGQSYTISSVYHAGQLQLYAHHPTAPISEGGRPEYHMTQVGTWATTGNIDSFRRGATAFRNARDLAKQHRDGFIQAANAKASHPRPSASHTNPPGWWDGDEALQQDISNAYDDNFGDGGEEAAIPQGFYTGEDSVDDASLEVAASFTPGS
ncbi:hypothetical protein SCUCBS95973_009252 [Sporothrix curviconia]|uniref:DUF7924 domain-containing protein n=1 Tax=Sporothrix curviconia TaxID=1260050 RepID=A0ABP0CWH9_9PEZI